MLDNATMQENLSSLTKSYALVDTKQFAQIAELQNGLRTVFEENSLLETQRQVSELFERSGIKQMQEQIRNIMLPSNIQQQMREQTSSITKIVDAIKLSIQECKQLYDADQRVYTPTSQNRYANDIFPSSTVQSPRQISNEAQDSSLAISISYREPHASIATQSTSHTTNMTIEFSIEIDYHTTVSLLQYVSQDDFIAGEISATEQFIESIAHEYGWKNTMRWLKRIYIDHYSNVDLLKGILHSLSHYEYHDVNPDGTLLALGVLQHQDIYVRNYAIRAFENWNSKEVLPVLKSLNCDASWQQRYIDKVIIALEKGGV